MLYREIIAVCSQIYTKHINTLCGQNVAIAECWTGGIHSDHFALKVYTHTNEWLIKLIRCVCW